MMKYILTVILYFTLSVVTSIFSQSKPSELIPNTTSLTSKSTYYGELLNWNGPKKLFSISHTKDGKVTDADFFDINGKKVGSCTYIDNYPYTGTMLDHDFIWTVITKKTYVKGFVVGTIIEYDITFKEMNKYAANNLPTMNAENYQKASTKDGKPYNGKFVVEYALVEYKNGLMHGFKKNFDFLTRDTTEIISYLNGKKEGVYQYLAIKDSVLAQGYYKNDQPFSGSFLDLNQFVFKTFNVFEEGVLVGINTYQFAYFPNKTNKIKSYKLINTCSFKDNKAVSGSYYDKTKYKFFSYADGDLTRVYSINDKKFDTTEIQSYYKGKFHGYCKSKINAFANDLAVGYYRNGEPYIGEFKDLKDKNIINRYVNGYHIASMDYTVGTPPNFYTFTNGKKDGASLQRIAYSGDTTRYHSIYKEGLPFEGQICVGNEILRYNNGKLNGQCVLLDGSKKKIRKKTYYINGVITKVVHYKVFNSIDSIATNYVDGRIISGQDIQYADYTTKAFTYQEGFITGDSTRFENDTNYMIYKDGEKYEGIEYTMNRKYVDTVQLDLKTTYKDFKIINMQGGAQRDLAHFDMSCDEQKCILLDYSPLNYKTEIVNNHISSIQDVTTYKDQILLYSGTIKNDRLDSGTFAFVNYASRFDKLFNPWTSAIITITHSTTTITVLNNKQRFAENFLMKQKLGIRYPVYNLSNVLSFRNFDDYTIEYLDTATNKNIASCQFINGTPITGITLEQYEGIIKVTKYKEGNEVKIKEMHIADLLTALSNF